jgi:hypothetical protein
MANGRTPTVRVCVRERGGKRNFYPAPRNPDSNCLYSCRTLPLLGSDPYADLRRSAARITRCCRAWIHRRPVMDVMKAAF